MSRRPIDARADRDDDAPLRHAYAYERNGRWMKTFCGAWVPDRELAPSPSAVTCPACVTETQAFDAMEI